MLFNSVNHAQAFFDTYCSSFFCEATYALVNENIPNLYIVKCDITPIRVLIYCTEQDVQVFCHNLSHYRVGAFRTDHIGEFVVKTTHLSLTVKPQLSSVSLSYTMALSKSARIIAGVTKSFHNHGHTGCSIGLEFEI